MRRIPEHLQDRPACTFTEEEQKLVEEIYQERVAAMLEARSNMPPDTVSVVAMIDVAINSAASIQMTPEQIMRQVACAMEQHHPDVKSMEIQPVRLPDDATPPLFPQFPSSTRYH